MRFFRSTVEVGTVPPPEEILTSVSGTCGLWQICICVVSCVSFFMWAMDTVTSAIAVPELNYTCADGNGSDCSYVNGTKCKNFKFFYRSSNITTFTETLLLVCEHKRYIFLIRILRKVGEAIGPIFAAITAVKLGIKAASMVFISLQCLTGFLILIIKTLPIFTLFYFTHGLFASALCLYAMVVVCNSTGNNLRTFTLGTLTISFYLSFGLCPHIINMFTNITSVVAVNSILPLILLLPLLFYQDSPTSVSFLANFSKAEEVLRQIGKINRCPISAEVRIRPVHILRDHKQPRQSPFHASWKSKEIRMAFLGLLCLHFFFGYYYAILTHFASINQEEMLWRPLYDNSCIVIALIFLHLVSHKFFMAVVTFARNLCFGVFFVNEAHAKSMVTFPAAPLLLIIAPLLGMGNLVLYTLAVRMYPTEQRAVHLGLSWSICFLGSFLADVIFMYPEHAIWINVFSVLLSLILESISCFVLWNVHKRELPDFLVDCLRYETYYKPTRFHCIYNRKPSEHEFEVKKVELDKDVRLQKSRTEGTSLKVTFSNRIQFEPPEIEEIPSDIN